MPFELQSNESVGSRCEWFRSVSAHFFDNHEGVPARGDLIKPTDTLSKADGVANAIFTSASSHASNFVRGTSAMTVKSSGFRVRKMNPTLTSAIA